MITEDGFKLTKEGYEKCGFRLFKYRFWRTGYEVTKDNCGYISYYPAFHISDNLNRIITNLSRLKLVDVLAILFGIVSCIKLCLLFLYGIFTVWKCVSH